MPSKKDYKPTAIRMYNDMVNDFTQEAAEKALEELKKYKT